MGGAFHWLVGVAVLVLLLGGWGLVQVLRKTPTPVVVERVIPDRAGYQETHLNTFAAPPIRNAEAGRVAYACGHCVVDADRYPHSCLGHRLDLDLAG